MQYSYLLEIFSYCYQWKITLIPITKNQETVYRDFGTYELKHLPEKGSLLEQNNKLMSALEYVKYLMLDLKSKTNG